MWRRRQQRMCERSNDIADNSDAPCNWTNRNHNDDDDTLECAHMAKQGGHLSFNVFFLLLCVYLAKCAGKFTCTICIQKHAVACVKCATIALPSLRLSNNQLTAPIGINFVGRPAVSAFWIQQLCARRCYPTTSPFLCNAIEHVKMQAAATLLNKCTHETIRETKTQRKNERKKLIEM